LIHKVKHVSYMVTSHGHSSTISSKGKLTSTPALMISPALWTKGYIKKLTWHLSDVLKCIRSIEKALALKRPLNIQETKK